eukprot:750633-Hanusia_phi.AAC.3
MSDTQEPWYRRFSLSSYGPEARSWADWMYALGLVVIWLFVLRPLVSKVSKMCPDCCGSIDISMVPDDDKEKVWTNDAVGSRSCGEEERVRPIER